ncbi:MAG: OmpA family protein [Campylobacterota bacterium]|nr:OmpA family protein [Campylobacterota bacterium]
MKKVLMLSATIALLVLSGCSSKDSSIDPYDNGVEIKPDTTVQTETIEGTGISVDTSDSNEMTMSALESRMQNITFAFDKFNISSDMQDRVDANSALASGNAANYAIKLEGNCDEWGSDEYNYALGLKRANSVKNTMIKNGIDASRITMISYGESNPACTDKTDSCWAQNRRVDTKVLP